MKAFPPNPLNSDEAISYVKKIPRRKGVTDYQAIREAGIRQLGIAPIFFVLMVTSANDLNFLETVLGIAVGTFGVLAMILGCRTLQLLDLFPNTNLPMPKADHWSDTVNEST